VPVTHDPYRGHGPLAKLPPRAPWWRLALAAITGRLTRIADRRWRHGYGIVRDPVTWARRDLGRRFTDEEIDRHLPPSLRLRHTPVAHLQAQVAQAIENGDATHLDVAPIKPVQF
jgi:hypothetical protein